MSSRELYIGNLDRDTKTHEIKDIFERYGNVSRCEVKFGLPGKIMRKIKRTNFLK